MAQVKKITNVPGLDCFEITPDNSVMKRIVMCYCSARIIDKQQHSPLSCCIGIDDTYETIADEARHLISNSLSTYRCEDIQELLEMAKKTESPELKALVALMHNYMKSRVKKEYSIEVIFGFRDVAVPAFPTNPKIGEKCWVDKRKHLYTKAGWIVIGD